MAFLQTTAASISSGGTINGDLTISGDLTVTGAGGGFAYTEVITGDVQINGAAGTGAASAGVLVLSTAETTVRVGTVDQLGRIDFQAPSETGGSDAILVGASIFAEAEEDFSSTNNSTGLVFSTATTSAPIERMRIDQDGNVGIGDTAPSQKLDIGAGHILLDNTYGLYFGDTQVGIAGTTATDAIQFFTSNAAKMTLDASGRFGIGGTPSTHQLEVHGADWDTSLLVKASGANSGMTFMDSAGNKDVQFMAGTMSLKVLINTTSRMKIDDNSRISLSNNDSGANNTVFGKLAGANLASGGNENTLIGEGAGNALTTGQTNVAIGREALFIKWEHYFRVSSWCGCCIWWN